MYNITAYVILYLIVLKLYTFRWNIFFGNV